MSDNDRKVILAMHMYGGSFIKALAELAHFADSDNLEKIKNAWSEEWEKYSKFELDEDGNIG